MSALDKIIAEILDQAGAQAAEIISEANQKAAEILQKGNVEREEWQRQSDKTTESECQKITTRAESADRQNRRRALLETRNLILDDVMTEAKAKLSGEIGQERFKIVQQGNILLNNSIDAIFEAESQVLRDKAYEALTSGE